MLPNSSEDIDESQHAAPSDPPLAMTLVLHVVPPSVLHPWNSPEAASRLDVTTMWAGFVWSTATAVSLWLPGNRLTFTLVGTARTPERSRTPGRRSAGRAVPAMATRRADPARVARTIRVERFTVPPSRAGRGRMDDRL